MEPNSSPKGTNFRKKGRKRRSPKGGSEFGDFLLTLRTDQGWTLITAASESGISHRVIAKLEKGGLDTSVEKLEKYLNTYGFTLAARPIESGQAETAQSSVSLDDKGLPKW